MMKHKADLYVPQRDKLKNELCIHDRIPWTEKQKEFIRIALDKQTKVIICKSPPGTGKAQPLDALLLTPIGWKQMGDVKVGDLVYSENGKPTQVLGVYPQGEQDVYKITFSDGTSTECSKDHLWTTKTDEEETFSVKTTKDIINSLKTENKLNHRIPICKAVVLPEQITQIPPYIMGTFLGGGMIKRSAITLNNIDNEAIKKVDHLLPNGMRVVNGGFRCDILDTFCSIIKSNRFIKELKNFNLLSHQSQDKFIPDVYLFNSIEKRIELLRGLMDTGGSINECCVIFRTFSEKLTKGIVFLAQSLGGSATVDKQNHSSQPTYVVYLNLPDSINPFYIGEKARKVISNDKMPVRYISNVEFVGRKQCQCIFIDNSSHLYLTNDFIVTHNTLLSVYCSLVKLKEKKVSEIIYVRAPVESCSKGIGFLAGDKNEKMEPYLSPAIDHLKALLDKPAMDMLIKEERFVIASMGFLKGRTFAVNACIADEAEDLTLQEFELLMTRMGLFSILFIIGDVNQSNIRNSGFNQIYNAFNTEASKQNGIHTFEFTKDDCMRSGIIKHIVEVFENIRNSK